MIFRVHLFQAPEQCTSSVRKSSKSQRYVWMNRELTTEMERGSIKEVEKESGDPRGM